MGNGRCTTARASIYQRTQSASWICFMFWNGFGSSTSALFVAPTTPIFPGFSRMVARLFANPRGPVGFQELKNTSFFQAFLVTALSQKSGTSLGVPDAGGLFK